MGKEKYNIEYVFDKASKNALWNRIATPAGLAEWFADDVTNNGDVFTFIWDNYPSEAELVGINPNNSIRFHWLDDEDPETYFEFRLQTIELTGGLLLEIVDFATPGEKDDAIILWDNEIKILKRILGL